MLFRAILQERQIKSLPSKKEIKLSWLAGDMISCIENPKDSIKTKKTTIRNNKKNSNTEGHKINIQISDVFLYTIKERKIKNLRKKVLFKISLKKE